MTKPAVPLQGQTRKMRLLLSVAIMSLAGSVGGFVNTGGVIPLRARPSRSICAQGGSGGLVAMLGNFLGKVPLPTSKKLDEEAMGEVGQSLKRFIEAAPGGIVKQMEEQVIPMAKAAIFKENIAAPDANTKSTQAVDAVVGEMKQERGVGIKKKREFFADFNADMTTLHASSTNQPESQVVGTVGDASAKEEAVGKASERLWVMEKEIEKLLSVSVADEFEQKELSISSMSWGDDDDENSDRPSPRWMIDSPNKHQ